MMFDTKPYFSEYAENIGKVVEDLCDLQGGLLCGEQIGLRLKLASVARLPIFRGYEEENGKKHWLDIYKFSDNASTYGLYTSKELSDKLKGQTVRFDMLAKNGSGGEYARHLSIGIKELFYYKENVDGIPKDYCTDKNGVKTPDKEEQIIQDEVDR